MTSEKNSKARAFFLLKFLGMKWNIMIPHLFYILQESPADFTRVALPSIKYYVQVIWEFMKRIERRSLSLVLSADSDGKEFAGSMTQVAKDEKWVIKNIFWLIGNSTLSPENTIESIISHKSDVVVVHSRDRHIERLFRAFKELANTTDAIWVLTDITEYGISDIDVLPTGLIKISARLRETNCDYTLYSDAIYDALLLYQVVFEAVRGKNRYQTSEEEACFGEIEDSKDVQDLVKM